ncbi:MAG: hypothetical protein IJT95_05165 [Abditibacteriota bacterium]|nr:hypothetical protein [Abditibacteriota bacterium]
MLKLLAVLVLLALSVCATAERKPFVRENVNYRNIRDYVYTNAEIVRKPVKGIFVNFHGAGYTDTRDEDSPFAKALAEAGVVEIFPYGTQNSWMKAGLAREVRHCVDVIRREHRISDSVPVAFGGCSMGGFAALTFGLFSGIRPACILVNCPVTVSQDWVDFQRPGLLPDALEGILLPLDVINRLPKTDYFIISGTNDPIPGLAANTEKLAEGLRARGLTTEFYSGPIGHCGATAEQTLLYNRFLYDRLGVAAPDNPYGSWY